VGKTIQGLIEEARQLPLPQQLSLIEHLARFIQMDLERERALHDEFAGWDDLSDEALAKFEKGL
jgi:hypothetical protein